MIPQPHDPFRSKSMQFDKRMSTGEADDLGGPVTKSATTLKNDLSNIGPAKPEEATSTAAEKRFSNGNANTAKVAQSQIAPLISVETMD